MIKLIRLERAKMKFTKYTLSAVIISVVIILMTASMGIFAENGEIVFNGVKELLLAGDLLIRVSFTILAGVLLAQVVIKEFERDTIKILFTYPISRKKIMLAKLLVVFGMTMFLTLFSELLFISSITLLNNSFQITKEMIDFSMIKSYLIHTALFSGITTACIGLVPLYFGMIKKSVIVTISSAVVVSLVLNGNVGGDGISSNAFSFSLVPITLCIIGITMAYLAFFRIDRKDIL
ncbi:ABC transporter permease [Candidatus Enterococcus mansonii]|uniref:ABC transporter permease n=1 Tax=Candidatus Enterococcus mansonii TaxID=1834181 RepID=A0A242CIH4_9ENTE|nr:ABC transporter permease [Enterococcus sp. 4G2_DIV0659]OTO10044.1 hypothetical protein A5880_000727 [Enterococcus sp. 4G2_DIV0659]